MNPAKTDPILEQGVSVRQARPRVLQVVPSLGIGGAESVGAFLGTHFGSQGLEGLCSVFGGPLENRLRDAGVRYSVFEAYWRRLLKSFRIARMAAAVVRRERDRRRVRSSRDQFTDMALQLPGLGPWFAGLLSRHQYEVVHLHTLACVGLARVAKRMGLRVIYGHHNMLSERYGEREIDSVKKDLEFVDTVVCVSRACAIDFCGAARWPSERTATIPNPSFLAAGRKRTIEQVRVIGTASNLLAAKGIDVLIGAWGSFSADRGLRLRIAGGGIGAVQFWRRVATETLPGNRPVFLGVLEKPSEMIAFYDAIDMLVVPSRTEAFPLVAVEAMSRGIPIVASDIAPLRETVGEGGLFFPVGDVAALAGCLEAAREPDVVRKLSDAGFERWKALYNPARILEAYSQVYRGNQRGN